MWKDEWKASRVNVNKEKQSSLDLISIHPTSTPAQRLQYILLKVRGGERQRRRRESESETETLFGRPPWGIRRSGNAWRGRLRYLFPPTPLNPPWPQNTQQCTTGAHGAPTLEPQVRWWERVEEVRRKERESEREIHFTSLALIGLF